MTNWQHIDDKFRQILQKHDDPNNELESVAKTKAELVPHLKNTPHFKRLSALVIEEMEKATTFHSFNQALDKVFDYADDYKIWIEL